MTLARKAGYEALRDRVREYPWAKEKLAKAGPLAQFTSVEGLIDSRLRELIGRIVAGTETANERSEYDTLSQTRVDLMR